MPRPRGIPKTGGRKKGVPNKVTTSMRQVWLDAFDRLGGVDALVRWGSKPENETEFYKLSSKLIPLDITSGTKELSALTHAWTFGDRKVTF